MSEKSENEKLAEELFAEIKKTFSDGTEISRENKTFICCGKYLTVTFVKRKTRFGNTLLFIYRYSVEYVVDNFNSCDIRPVFWLWVNAEKIQTKTDQYSVTHNCILAKMLALISKRVAE